MTSFSTFDSTKMNPDQKQISDRINQMMDDSYGCAESFVTAVGEYLWGDVDNSIKMVSTGFSGGVGGTHEELCGGVSGAALIFGLLHGRTTNDEAIMVRCKRLIAEHRDRFVQEFGTTTCQNLRDAEFGADEEHPCSALIIPAALMLLDILEEEKERELDALHIMDDPEHQNYQPFEDFKKEFSNVDSDTILMQTERPDLPHLYRDWIGDQLNIRGDCRQGIGLRADGVPDIQLLPVPNGKVEIERAGEFLVDELMISKYPLTYMQYKVFLDDPNGYQNPVWWDGLGADQPYRHQPGEQRFSGDNYPRDNISWFDAVAYCRWLNDLIESQLDNFDFPWIKNFRDKKWHFRLPTEWEWKMAATGGNSEQKYPWGSKWNENFAHTKHNQLNKSMAVGMYPSGASAIGALDMSGNIWEWCMNCYDEPANLDLSRSDRRVLRGGSWYHWGSYAHTDMRSRYYPDHRYNAGGLRVACGKALS